MKVTVKAINKYGKIFLYPADETAKLFLELTKNKLALTKQDIDIIKKLGYEVEVEQEKIIL